MTVSFFCGRAAAAEPGPSVTDVVEFTRIMSPSGSDEEQLRQQVSPDRLRAFIVTRKANTRTDRNRYEILLLDLRPERLVPGHYEAPVAVASLEPVVDDSSSRPSVTDLRWADDRTIVFRARLTDALFQVFQVDTVTRALTQLTFSPTGVFAYAVSEDLRTVLYAAQQNNPPVAEGQRGVVVGNRSFWSVMHGQNDLVPQVQKYRYFVAERGKAGSPRRLGDDLFDLVTPWPLMSLSPDGRWAVLPHIEPGRHLQWIKDYPLVADAANSIGPSLLMDPLSYFSRPGDYVPMRMLAYRLSDGKAQAIVDAPDSGTANVPTQLLWLDSGGSLIIAGTHLPMQDRGGVVRSNAAHIVEYWPDSGRWEVIATVKGRVKAARAHSHEAFSATDDDGSRQFRRLAGGGWQVVGEPAAEPSDAGSGKAGAWSLRIRQSLDVPPEIVAEDAAGQSAPLTRLNTQVTSAWGSMRPYGWKDVRGRQWDGGLLVPAGAQPGTKWPLVIQTYGFKATNFYLDGANHHEVFTSGFAGRAFLQANILVLAFPVRPTTQATGSDRERIGAFMDGVRGAVEALVKDGLVDPERIGVMGWSATGERLLNQLTFSDLPVRAATLLDGDANTFFSSIVTYGFSDSTVARKERTNGGPPAGDTLATWIRNDPSMHTDCIKAAVRIETYGPWVKNNWDIYSLLRRQYKAAEMVVIPKGTHSLHTPSERMLSLQGNVDWFRFWLTGSERTEPYPGESDETLREQYRRWRQMAELKKVDDAKPACARKGEGF